METIPFWVVNVELWLDRMVASSEKDPDPDALSAVSISVRYASAAVLAVLNAAHLVSILSYVNQDKAVTEGIWWVRGSRFQTYTFCLQLASHCLQRFEVDQE